MGLEKSNNPKFGGFWSRVHGRIVLHDVIFFVVETLPARVQHVQEERVVPRRSHVKLGNDADLFDIEKGVCLWLDEIVRVIVSGSIVNVGIYATIVIEESQPPKVRHGSTAGNA